MRGIAHREQAWLQSPSLTYFGAWSISVPIKVTELHQLQADFQAAVRYRLGLPLLAFAKGTQRVLSAFWTSLKTMLSTPIKPPLLLLSRNNRFSFLESVPKPANFWLFLEKALLKAQLLLTSF